MDSARRPCAGRTLQLNIVGNVHRHPDCTIVLLTVTERLAQNVEVSLMTIAIIVLIVHILTHYRTDIFVHIAVNGELLKLAGLPDVT